MLPSEDLLPDPPIEEHEFTVDRDCCPYLGGPDTFLDASKKCGVYVRAWGLIGHAFLLSYQFGIVWRRSGRPPLLAGVHRTIA